MSHPSCTGWVGVDRDYGWLSARIVGGLAERGLLMDERYLVEGAYTFESGMACAQHLLSLTPRPTAIFAANDETAAGVYLAAHEAGVRIPHDLSVVGFDDSPIASKLWPPLTSVRLPIREIGAIAAKKLLAQGPQSSGELADFAVTPTLVARRSSSVPAPRMLTGGSSNGS